MVAAAGGTVGLVPGASIAQADIEQAELGVIRHRVPHGPTATEGPPFALPSRLGALQMSCYVGAPAVRDGIEAPEFLPVFAVVRSDISAHAHLRAGVADDHPAVDHARCAGDCIRLRAVHGQLRPDQPSSLTVERDQPAIQRSEVEAVAPGGPGAVDARAASQNGPLPRPPGVGFPEHVAPSATLRLPLDTGRT